MNKAQIRVKRVYELALKSDAVQALLDYLGTGKATFVYGSKDQRLNNVAALKEYLESKR